MTVNLRQVVQVAFLHMSDLVWWRVDRFKDILFVPKPFLVCTDLSSRSSSNEL